MARPACAGCGRTFRDGESAWVDEVKVIEPGGIRLRHRYTCDDCYGDIATDTPPCTCPGAYACEHPRSCARAGELPQPDPEATS